MLREGPLYKSCKEIYNDLNRLSKHTYPKITCLFAVLSLISALVFLSLPSHRSILYISLISLIIFFIATIIFIIKLRIFKSIKVRLPRRKNTANDINYPATESEFSVTERITERVKTKPARSGTVTCRFQQLSTLENTTAYDNNTLIYPDRFQITKNIIVIHSDPDTIK